jgi:toxin FitB
MVILDTNVVSELMDTEPDTKVISWLDRQAWTSLWTTSVTVMEVRYGLAIMPAGRRRAERQGAFARLIEEKFQHRILPFDEAAAEEAATLMGGRHRVGRPVDLRDTMIAGIAQAQRAALATRNIRHFEGLNVAVIDPWSA